MIYNVVISSQAENDLRGIFEYIAFELKSPQNAADQLEKLERKILSLEAMPDRHRVFDREPWRSRGLRILPTDNFVILYLTDARNLTVTIIRVMYGGRDIDKQLETD